MASGLSNQVRENCRHRPRQSDRDDLTETLIINT